MIRRTMPHQGVLSTNRVDRRRPRLRKIHSSLLEKILAIMQRVLMQARRAKALRASVSRRPCTTKKETPGEAPGVGVRLSQASTHWGQVQRTDLQVRIRARAQPMLLSMGERSE